MDRIEAIFRDRTIALNQVSKYAPVMAALCIGELDEGCWLSFDIWSLSPYIATDPLLRDWVLTIKVTH